MPAVEHHDPDARRRQKPRPGHLLQEQIRREKRRRDPHRHGDEREVQPRLHERAPAEGDRAERARQLAPPAPPAIEKGEGEGDEDFPRGLGGEGVAERQRQRQEADERERGALPVREERIAAAGLRVPQRQRQRLPRLPRLMRPRHDLHHDVVHLHVRDALLRQPT